MQTDSVDSYEVRNIEEIYGSSVLTAGVFNIENTCRVLCYRGVKVVFPQKIKKV